MRHYRRRRGVYISPLAAAAAVLAALLAAYLVLRLLESGEPPAPSGEPGQAELREPADREPPELSLPERVTTASGIPCTRAALEEAQIYTGELILVNNQVLYRFPEEEPPLVSIYEEKNSSYYVRDMEVLLSPAAMEPLNRMLEDFAAQGGSKTINVVAGYRTEEYQQHLFDQSARRSGQDHAERYVAQPGGSEHHTGLAVDFSILYRDGSSEDYDGSGEYAWINENCQDYGWVVRYEAGKESLTGIWDEPWHFRYVGVPHAVEMAREGLCLEEYIDYLKGFPFEGDHLTITCGTGNYEVWYTEGTEAVYLPDSGAYSISGNNVDGVIVTVQVG